MILLLFVALWRIMEISFCVCYSDCRPPGALLWTETEHRLGCFWARSVDFSPCFSGGPELELDRSPASKMRYSPDIMLNQKEPYSISEVSEQSLAGELDLPRRFARLEPAPRNADPLSVRKLKLVLV